MAVRKEIDKLIVRCANYQEDGEGCVWEGTLKAHEVCEVYCAMSHPVYESLAHALLSYHSRWGTGASVW